MHGTLSVKKVTYIATVLLSMLFYQLNIQCKFTFDYVFISNSSQYYFKPNTEFFSGPYFPTFRLITEIDSKSP